MILASYLNGLTTTAADDAWLGTAWSAAWIGIYQAQSDPGAAADAYAVAA